jgi:predicted aspartyl protease
MKKQVVGGLALSLIFGSGLFGTPQNAGTHHTGDDNRITIRDPVEVPFEYSRAFGLMLIKAEVNGKPAVMVLDTGSNETIVSPKLVIVKRLSSKDEVAMAKGSGYSGSGVIATASLSIGPLNPKSCQILVVDLSDLSKTLGQEIDGILGMSVLKEFEIVSVDLRHHKLVLK